MIEYTSVPLSIEHILQNSVNDATILIPDLQRPYVWKPYQVIMLLDSIFKQWPFGSLLTWDVSGREYVLDDAAEEKKGIPYRAFWTMVSRVPGVGGKTANPCIPPTTGGYTMILDGQQRIQSLILALGGSNFGMCLYDNDWAADRDQPMKGRKSEHYSMASLFLNLKSFQEKLDSDRFSKLSLADVIEWVIPNEESLSKTRRKDSYVYPLQRYWMTKDTYIPLHAIWRQSLSQTDDEAKDIAETLLTQYSISPDEKLTGNLKQLVQRFAALRGQLIYCLRIKSSQINKYWTAEDYDDAIVNIFTRLNTAGRTLTKEEITFAWLKRGWKETSAFKSAEDFVSEISKILKENEISVLAEIQTDDIVRLLTYIWAVEANHGQMLSDKDLLKHDKIYPMGEFLSQKASRIIASLGRAAEAIFDLHLNNITDSFNGIYTGCSLFVIGMNWIQGNSSATVVDRENYEKKLSKIFSAFISHWLIETALAKKWASHSQKFLMSVTPLLGQLSDAIQSMEDSSAVLEKIQGCCEKLLEECKDEAAEICLKNVQLRTLVSQYKLRLFTWQHLTEERMKQANKVLQLNKKQVKDAEVDHIISYQKWKEEIGKLHDDGKLTFQTAKALFSSEEDSDLSSREELIAAAETFINTIGNMSLLSKSFNVSKSNKDLGTFIKQIDDFKDSDTGEKNVSLQEWQDALKIPDILLEPFSGKYTIMEVVNALLSRESEIQRDLCSFIRTDTEELF